MRNKLKIIITLLLITMIFAPRTATALTSNVSLTCSASQLKAGGTTSCNIKVDVETGGLTAFSGTVVLSNNLELVSSTSSNIWQGNGSGGKFDVYTDTAKIGEVAIGSFVVKAKSGVEGTAEIISLNNITLGNELFEDLNPASVSKSIKVLSTNANLSALTVNTDTLTPTFDPSTTTYSVTTDNDSIIINATAVSGTVAGTGTKQLNYGTNSFNVVVTAKAGNTKTYTLNVTRKDNRSKDSKLKTLTLSEGTIKFVKETTSYDVTVDSNIVSITATGEANDSKATVKYNPSQTINLEYGKVAVITVVVTAENQTTTQYKINVTRKDDRSTNNYLKSLTLDEGTISFKKDTLNYTLTVENDIKTIKISATVEDSKSAVSGVGTKELNEGGNTFKLVVTSEKGTTKTYTITVNRKTKEGDVISSSDNTLKSINIEGVTLDFKKDTLEYKFDVENNVLKLKINYEVEDSKATAKIKGETDLQVGSNKIEIVVTSERGDIKTYTLFVNRKGAIKVAVDNEKSQINSEIDNKNNTDLIYVDVSTDDVNKKVAKDTLQKLKENEKEIVYEVKDKDDKLIYSVTIDGKTITSPTDFDYSLSFSSNEQEKLEMLTSEKAYISLNFSHSGVLPGKITFKIYVADQFKKLPESCDLYYFNIEENKLEVVKEGVQIINGYIEVELEHFSEYVLLEKVLPIKVEQPKDNQLTIIMSIIIAVLVVIIIILLVIKSRKNKKLLNSNVNINQDQIT